MTNKTPLRIQRKRTRGWKMPENTINVTRPGKWGNPFVVGDFVKIWGNREVKGYLKTTKEYATAGYVELKSIHDVLQAYEKYMRLGVPKDFSEIKGKDLACWCKIGEPCHADILLKIANQ